MRMITKFKMLPLLIEACPSFQARWEDFLAEYADGEVEPPLYEALGDYARHLIDLLEHDETSCFVEVFEVVERLCLHGDSYVQGAAIIGLLESLQNLFLYKKAKTAKREHFEAYLGVESTICWKALQDFWKKIPLTYTDE